MAIRIVTDSSADLPPELAQRSHITVLPCYVILDDVTYKDGVDLTHDHFYQQLTSNTRLPTTAQPSAADFQQAYEELLGQGHEVISIHVSGKLSGTPNSAEQARASLAETAPIAIIDSQLASIPLGLAVAAAAEQAEQAGLAQHNLFEPFKQVGLGEFFTLLHNSSKLVQF